MQAIISKSLEANTGLSSPASEYPIAEDVIAILGAIPSSIVIYLSVHYHWFLNSVGHITYVLAIAIGSTLALHFEAWRLVAKPIRTSRRM